MGKRESQDNVYIKQLLKRKENEEVNSLYLYRPRRLAQAGLVALLHDDIVHEVIHPSQKGPLVECCFTSTETVGLLGTGAQDGHLDFDNS